MPLLSAHAEVLHQSVFNGKSVADCEVDARALKFCPALPLPSSPIFTKNVDHAPSTPSKDPLGGTTIGDGCLDMAVWGPDSLAKETRPVHNRQNLRYLAAGS